MHFWASITMLAAFLLLSDTATATCSTLHSGWTWIIVQDGDEAFEYNAQSRVPGWRIEGNVYGLVPCANCGQVTFEKAFEPHYLLLQFLRERSLKGGPKPNGASVSLQVGPLEGEAQRFTLETSTQISQDLIALEASDGCVRMTLTLFDEGSLELSPFKDPQRIVDATLVTRIPRGKAQEIDLKCLKSTTIDDFELFGRWIGMNPSLGDRHPVKTPPHEEFMRGLDRLNR